MVLRPEPTPPARGPQSLYLGAVAAVAFATAWRALTPKGEANGALPNRDRPFALQWLRPLRRPRTRVIELDDRAEATVRVGRDRRPAVL